LLKKIAIGILAYNEESHIENVLNEILTLKKDVYVLNDSSTDKTMKILENNYTIKTFECPYFNEISLNDKDDYLYLLNKYFSKS